MQQLVPTAWSCGCATARAAAGRAPPRCARVAGRKLVVAAPAQPSILPAIKLLCCSGECLQIAQFCRDLALPQLEVAECGCLSNCGGGPNMVLLRHGASNGGDGAPLAQLAHMSTPARVAQGLQAFAGLQLGEAEVKVTELRLAGNAAARSGALGEAVALYSQVRAAHGSGLYGAWFLGA